MTDVTPAARRTVRGRCGQAGNYDQLNGVSVFSNDGALLGSIVGAYVEGSNLVRVRLAVDPQLVAGGGCVEYATAHGRAVPEGIVVNTTRQMLVGALSR